MERALKLDKWVCVCAGNIQSMAQVSGHVGGGTTYGWYTCMIIISLVPRLSRGRRKRAWYTPFAHALNYFKFLSLFASSTIAHS